MEIEQKYDFSKGTITFQTNFVPVDWYAKKWLIEDGVEVYMESEIQNSAELLFNKAGKALIFVTPNR